MQLAKKNATATDVSKISAKVGEVIRRFRLAAGLTPRELAEDIGASPSFVTRMESGEVEIDVLILERCATALGLEPSELLDAASSGAAILVFEATGESDSTPKVAGDGRLSDASKK